MRRVLLDPSVLIALNQRGEQPPDLSEFDELFVSSLSGLTLATINAVDLKDVTRLVDVVEV